MSATQDEDKKPGDGGAHINLKVKGQMLCFSCLSPITMYIEQNSMYRACVSCDKHTCLLCGKKSHFPAFCYEWSHFCDTGPRNLRSVKITVLDELIASCCQQMLAFSPRNMLSHQHPRINLLFSEMITLLNLVKYFQVACISDPNLGEKMVVEELELESVVEALIEVIPTPSTPPTSWEFEPARKNAATVAIKFLMSLLETRGLLENFRLLDCIPSFPVSLIPAENPYRVLVGPDGSSFLGNPPCVSLVLFYFHCGHMIPPDVSTIGSDENIPDMEDFMDSHSLDLTNSPRSLQVNMTLAIWAESFLWKCTMRRR